MLDLSKYKFLKYILFGNLYFINGIQGALGIIILVAYFTDIGITISITTMVAGLASLPFAFKFVFGPITDYFIKYGRKPFAIGGGIIAGLGLLPCAFINPKEALLPFSIFIFISVIGIVILDVAADAWAIQSTEISEHGKVNAAMFGSMFGGMAIFSIFLSYIAKIYNYPMTFFVSGIIILIAIVLPFLIKERKIINKRPKIAKLLITELKKKNSIKIAFFGFFTAMNFGVLLFVIPEYMMNYLKLDITQIGMITSLFPIGIVLGAIIGGLISDKYGRKITLFFSLIGSIIASSLLITANTWQILAIIYPILGFLQGGAGFAALMALFMDISNPKIGATQFSVLTSISNFGDYSIGIISGSIVVLLGYQRFFLFAAWLVGPALVILYFIKDTNK